jgi:hypothetical protein
MLTTAWLIISRIQSSAGFSNQQASVIRRLQSSAGFSHQQASVISRLQSSAGFSHHQASVISRLQSSAGFSHQQASVSSRLPSSAGFSHQHSSIISRLKSSAGLKVHKTEIFLASILKFVLFLCYLCQNIRILQKKFLIRPLLGEVRFFRVVLRLRGMKKNFELGQKNIFFFIYEPFK